MGNWIGSGWNLWGYENFRLPTACSGCGTVKKAEEEYWVCDFEQARTWLFRVVGDKGVHCNVGVL